MKVDGIVDVRKDGGTFGKDAVLKIRIGGGIRGVLTIEHSPIGKEASSVFKEFNESDFVEVMINKKK